MNLINDNQKATPNVDEDFQFVFVFPNFFSEREAFVQTVSEKKTINYCKSVYHSIFRIIENDPKNVVEQKISPTTKWIKDAWENFCKDTSNGEVEWIKFIRMVMTVAIRVLQEDLKLQIHSFFSRDQDEIFMKVRATEHNLRVYADLMDYQVQVNIRRPKGENELTGEMFSKEGFSEICPYGEFQNSINQHASIRSTYKAYKANGKKAHNDGEVSSVFLYKDKVRIVNATILSAIDTAVLLDHKIVTQIYCIHNEKELKNLEDEWGSFGAFWRPQPLRNIRKYFGEKIAMYFAWLEYYVFWLITPALAGLAVFIVGQLYETNDGSLKYELPIFIFSLVLSLGSTILDQLWQRRQSGLAWKWGTTDMIEVEQQRPGYIGKYSKDMVTGLKRKVNESLTIPRFKRSFGFSITMLFVFSILAMIIGIFIAKKEHEEYQSFFSLLNAVQIKIMNFVYRIVARKLNDWENYEYDSQYNNALTLKLYIFQFINSYSSLFYIAFFKSSCVRGQIDDPASCMKELYSQLQMILIINTMLNVVELGMPYLKMKLAIRKELKEIAKENLDGKHLRETVTVAESNSKLSDYETPLDDYMELIINYGYVVMFSIAYPLFPFISFLLNILEVRVDAFKVCVLSKRPFPYPANSIGTWEFIIKTIAIIGALTNIGILVFTAQVQFDLPFNEEHDPWVTFIIIEHILLIFKLLLMLIMPTVPTQVEEGLIWSKRIAAERIYGKAIDINQQKKLRNLYFKKSHDHKELYFDPREFRIDNY